LAKILWGLFSSYCYKAEAGLQPCAVGQGIPQSLRSGSLAGFFLILHDTLDAKAVKPQFPPSGHYK